MKARITLMLMAASLMLSSGCATNWMVDISTERIEVESPESNGLTATNALKLFGDVAGQLGLDVRGPVPQPRGNEPVIQYDAIAHSHLSLDLYITKSAINIYCCSDISLDEAKRAASSIERAFDERDIRYSISNRTGSFFN